MAEILEARVIQKVGTEAEWLANPLPLLDGEAAIVRTGGGTPVNLKFGDGGKTFAELPYFIDYSQAAYIAYTATPTQPVAYTFVGDGAYGAITVAPGYMAVLGWDGTGWSKNAEIEIPQTDVSGLVPKTSIKSNSLIQAGSPYLIANTVLASNGNVVTNATTQAGAYSIVDLPLGKSKTYTIGGFLQSGNKLLCLVSDAGVVKTESIVYLGTLPKTFTTDETYYKLRCVVKLNNTTEPGDNWTTTLMLNEGSILLPLTVNNIEGKSLSARALDVDNTVPDPVNPKNGVNKSYLETTSVLKSELKVKPSNNLADKSYLVYGQYVNSAGGLTGTPIPEAEGVWVTYKIPLSGILPIGYNSDTNPIYLNFGNFSINTSGYSAFYNGSTMVLFNGSHTNGTLPKKVLIPSTPSIPTHAYITVARPANTKIDWEKTMINVGAELLPYEPVGELESIAGYTFPSGGDGKSYDQDLNTFDAVKFAEAEIGTLKASVLVLNLPTSPTGLLPGRGYLESDGSGNYFIKAKG